MQLFDDPNDKLVHMVDPDDDRYSKCGKPKTDEHVEWPASSMKDLYGMVGQGFDYSLCEKCRYTKISTYE